MKLELPGVLAYGASSLEAVSKAEVLALRVIAERLEHNESRPYLDKHFYSNCGMSQWPSVKAKRLLATLLRLGWQVKRQSGSHKTLTRNGWPDFFLPFMMATKSAQKCERGLQSTRGYPQMTCNLKTALKRDTAIGRCSLAQFVQMPSH